MINTKTSIKKVFAVIMYSFITCIAPPTGSTTETAPKGLNWGKILGIGGSVAAALGVGIYGAVRLMKRKPESNGAQLPGSGAQNASGNGGNEQTNSGYSKEDEDRRAEDKSDNAPPESGKAAISPDAVAALEVVKNAVLGLRMTEFNKLPPELQQNYAAVYDLFYCKDANGKKILETLYDKHHEWKNIGESLQQYWDTDLLLRRDSINYTNNRGINAGYSTFPGFNHVDSGYVCTGLETHDLDQSVPIVEFLLKIYQPDLKAQLQEADSEKQKYLNFLITRAKDLVIKEQGIWSDSTKEEIIAAKTRRANQWMDERLGGNGSGRGLHPVLGAALKQENQGGQQPAQAPGQDQQQQQQQAPGDQ